MNVPPVTFPITRVPTNHRVDDADAIVRALRHLSDNQRQTVVLRFYAHLTKEQMATALAVASGTIKARLSRALKSLADNKHLTELRDPL